MARRKRKSSARVAILALVAIAVVAIAGWVVYQRFMRSGVGTPSLNAAAVDVSSARIDPANDGRRVRVSGQLEVTGPARDEALGISANAIVLFRKVEMFQWRERCAGDDCSYETAWSEQPIDSHKFRHREGHENPAQKLVDGRFAGAGIRLGAFTVAADLIPAQAATIDHPVHAADLPPNLAATFTDAGGVLYAGGDVQHPQVGAVRVRYRSAPPGVTTLTGVQRGGSLSAD